MNNSALNIFKEQKERANKLLEKLLAFINAGKDVNVNFDNNIILKLERAMQSIQDNEVMKVALVGGFSDGKTSIVASWLEKYDSKTMLISQQESSDAVNVYSVDNEMMLVDTPGLYGFKEKYNPESKEIEKFKEITKKYVSEAHIVLYVLDSKNPIKESHREDLHWLFRSLGLLNRTVFVLSKFDEVSDIEDEDDYSENLSIKKANVISRLKQIIALTVEEEKEVAIVGVSANPFGLGTEYWLNNLEQLKMLSRIDTLQEATRDVILNNGGPFKIAVETQKSIVKDIISVQLPKIENQKNEMDRAYFMLEGNYNTLKDNYNNTKEAIITAQINIKEFLVEYFNGLILRARGCDMDTFVDFLVTEIGDDGELINTCINIEVTRQTKNIYTKIEQVQLQFNSDIEHYNSIMGAMARDGFHWINMNKEMINGKNLKVVRDGTVAIAEKLGINVSKTFKFKPWGFTKLANNLCKTLAVLEIAVEAWDSYDNYKKKQKFEEAVGNLVQELIKCRTAYINAFAPENIDELFPEFAELRNVLENERKNIEEYNDFRERFDEWYSEAEILEVDYQAL